MFKRNQEHNVDLSGITQGRISRTSGSGEPLAVPKAVSKAESYKDICGPSVHLKQTSTSVYNRASQ